MMLGAGRKTITDKIDHSVGVVLHNKVGDFISIGDVVATIYSNKEDNNEEISMILDSFNVSFEKITPKLILDVIK